MIQVFNNRIALLHLWLHQDFYLMSLKAVTICNLLKSLTVILDSIQVTVHLPVLTSRASALFLNLVENGKSTEDSLLERSVDGLLLV